MQKARIQNIARSLARDLQYSVFLGRRDVHENPPQEVTKQ